MLRGRNVPNWRLTSALNPSSDGLGFIFKSRINEYHGDLDFTIFFNGSQYAGSEI
jgi:hypothetical protein